MWSKWLKKCENNWNTHIWFIFQPPPLSFSLSLSLSLYLSLSHHTHTRTLKNMHAHINALPRAHTHTHTHTLSFFLSHSLSQSSTATLQLQTMLLERHKLGHKVMIPKIHVFWKMMSRALAAKRMRPAENISLHLIVNLTLVSWRWDTRWKKTLWRKKFEALGQKQRKQQQRESSSCTDWTFPLKVAPLAALVSNYVLQNIFSMDLFLILMSTYHWKYLTSNFWELGFRH